jgi:alkylation response protein AidB-like acyl-CoA dehydrogenase
MSDQRVGREGKWTRRALAQGQIHFDNVRLDRDFMITEPDQYVDSLNSTHALANVSTALLAFGAGRAAYEGALDDERRLAEALGRNIWTSDEAPFAAVLAARLASLRARQAVAPVQSLAARLGAGLGELQVEAVEGQVQVGSSGPLTLHGSEVQIDSFMRLGSTLYRDNAGTLQFSTDNGQTWTPVCSHT